MELNTVSLGDFVKLAGVLWYKKIEGLPQEARKSGMFVEVPIPKNSGNTREFSEIDLEEYADEKEEGDQATRARVQQGYSKTMTKKRVAKDIGITFEMRDENKYQEVIRRLTNLSMLAYNRMDLDLQHRIGFGTATTYTNKNGRSVDISVGDTLALYSTVHTLRGSSTTFRNRLAGNGKLSRGTLEGMENLIATQTYNQFGEKTTAMPFDILWTTDDPNTVNTAREYLKSTASPDAAHAGVTNVYAGKYRHVILSKVATDANGAPDTTKAAYWGLASSMGSSAYLGIWEEPRLKVPADGNSGEEFSTDNWNFGVRGGFGITIAGAMWIKFSSGDGTA
jgi:hypothetical protein